MSKDIEQYLSKHSAQMSLPPAQASKRDPDDVKKKADKIFHAIFQEKIRYFADTEQDEEYFLNSFTRFLVEVFPQKVETPKKPRGDSEKLRQARLKDYSPGGALYYKTKEFSELYGTKAKLASYKKDYKNPNLPSESWNPPTNAEERIKFVESRREYKAQREKKEAAERRASIAKGDD